MGKLFRTDVANEACGSSRHTHTHRIVGALVFLGRVRTVWYCPECMRTWHEPVPSRWVEAK